LEIKNRIKFIDYRYAQKMARGGNPQGILVDVEDFKEANLSDLKRERFILILDSLTRYRKYRGRLSVQPMLWVQMG